MKALLAVTLLFLGIGIMVTAWQGRVGSFFAAFIVPNSLQQNPSS